jgi:hypothetical protein
VEQFGDYEEEAKATGQFFISLSHVNKSPNFCSSTSWPLFHGENGLGTDCG